MMMFLMDIILSRPRFMTNLLLVSLPLAKLHIRGSMSLRSFIPTWTRNTLLRFKLQILLPRKERVTLPMHRLSDCIVTRTGKDLFLSFWALFPFEFVTAFVVGLFSLCKLIGSWTGNSSFVILKSWSCGFCYSLSGFWSDFDVILARTWG
jgi:hypothetical protein